MTTATMTVWDVDLGLAIHVKAPNGRYIVVDLGSTPELSPLSKIQGADVGLMVITHPHLDHFSDIKNVNLVTTTALARSKAYSRDELLDGVRDCDKEIFTTYCDFEQRFNVPVSVWDDPGSIYPFAGLTANIFWPQGCDKANKNNVSAIVVLSLLGNKIVVCGDNETESFEYLMSLPSFCSAVKHADVLVAAHHGRASGYYEDFVRLVEPSLTIISDTAKGDTSVSEKYSALSSGRNVRNVLTGGIEFRKCLTTRQDGNIKIEFGSGLIIAKTHN